MLENNWNCLRNKRKQKIWKIVNFLWNPHDLRWTWFLVLCPSGLCSQDAQWKILCSALVHMTSDIWRSRYGQFFVKFNCHFSAENNGVTIGFCADPFYDDLRRTHRYVSGTHIHVAHTHVFLGHTYMLLEQTCMFLGRTHMFRGTAVPRDDQGWVCVQLRRGLR